jgi:hypothetical protein
LFDIVWLSQYIEIGGIGFSTNVKSMNNSLSHSTSIVALSSATSSVSMVYNVKIVYLQDLHETIASTKVNTYPIVILISAASEIQLKSL